MIRHGNAWHVALAPPYLATFNYLSPLPVASLGGSPPSFISSLDCEETWDLAYGENHRASSFRLEP